MPYDPYDRGDNPWRADLDMLDMPKMRPGAKPGAGRLPPMIGGAPILPPGMPMPPPRPAGLGMPPMPPPRPAGLGALGRVPESATPILTPGMTSDARPQPHSAYVRDERFHPPTPGPTAGIKTGMLAGALPMPPMTAGTPPSLGTAARLPPDNGAPPPPPLPGTDQGGGGGGGGPPSGGAPKPPGALAGAPGGGMPPGGIEALLKMLGGMGGGLGIG